jgi:hypothetical protein
MGKRAHWFCFTLILLGFLDWLITMVGVLFFGAQEINPLFAGLTQTNMVLFSVLKLSATFLVGFLFYQGGTMVGKQNGYFAGGFLFSGYLMSLAVLTAIVTNNIVAVLGIV